jgi:hypothetical protein
VQSKISPVSWKCGSRESRRGPNPTVPGPADNGQHETEAIGGRQGGKAARGQDTGVIRLVFRNRGLPARAITWQSCPAMQLAAITGREAAGPRPLALWQRPQGFLAGSDRARQKPPMTRWPEASSHRLGDCEMVVLRCKRCGRRASNLHRAGDGDGGAGSPAATHR